MFTKPLTQREKEVVHGVMEGKSNKKISSDLNIKERTVTSHLQKIFPKLNVQSRFEIIARFRDVDEL